MNPHEHDQSIDSQQFWNSRYGESDQIWSGRVNSALIEIASDLTPGRALDVGCGEGGDSIWLAHRGWHVTGLDISNTALRRARQRAESEGVLAERITWIEQDLAHWDPTEEYDFISACFLQSQIEFPRERILRTLKEAVAPGGTLAIVSHGAPPPWARDSHREHGCFPTPAEDLLALDLDPANWRVIASELRGREATAPDGQAGTLQDSVSVVQRSAGVRE